MTYDTGKSVMFPRQHVMFPDNVCCSRAFHVPGRRLVFPFRTSSVIPGRRQNSLNSSSNPKSPLSRPESSSRFVCESSSSLWNDPLPISQVLFHSNWDVFHSLKNFSRFYLYPIFDLFQIHLLTWTLEHAGVPTNCKLCVEARPFIC